MKTHSKEEIILMINERTVKIASLELEASNLERLDNVGRGNPKKMLEVNKKIEELSNEIIGLNLILENKQQQ
jgi:hypothetical protein